jgi:hypothetical protein
LSCLAAGAPAVEPFALLDGVDLEDTSVPEPSTLVLLGCGLAGGLGFLKTRKQK